MRFNGGAAVLFIAWLGIQSLSAEEAASPTFWDQVSTLSLREDQAAQVSGLQIWWNARQAALSAARGSNVPPDVLQRAQMDHATAVKVINRRLDELLDPEQKATWTSIRSGAGGDEEAEDAVEKSAPATHRLPPRATLDEADYSQQAQDLRRLYAGPVTNWPAPHIDDAVRGHYVELGLLPAMPYPDENPYHPAKAALGKQLFFDPRLSGSGQISCSSCHDADLGWADGRTVSFGHARKVLKRNAPTVQNAGHLPALFWDGRVVTLEQQAEAVLRNDDEMRSHEALISERLSQLPGYTGAFAQVFGESTVTMARVAQAIATFERTITSRSSPFDSFLRGDEQALSDAAVRGLHLFRTTARCVNCHHGPLLTDSRFHNEGLTYYGRKFQDLGRYEITRQPGDVGAFKTPSLRNIGRTGPYMHLGLFDLDGVLNMYNAGMPTPRRRPEHKDDPLYPQKSPLLKPLGLNKQDLADLKAFLESLTETRQRMMPPDLPDEVGLARP